MFAQKKVSNPMAETMIKVENNNIFNWNQTEYRQSWKAGVKPWFV